MILFSGHVFKMSTRSLSGLSAGFHHPECIFIPHVANNSFIKLISDGNVNTVNKTKLLISQVLHFTPPITHSQPF